MREKVDISDNSKVLIILMFGLAEYIEFTQ